MYHIGCFDCVPSTSLSSRSPSRARLVDYDRATDVLHRLFSSSRIPSISSSSLTSPSPTLLVNFSPPQTERRPPRRPQLSNRRLTSVVFPVSALPLPRSFPSLSLTRIDHLQIKQATYYVGCPGRPGSQNLLDGPQMEQPTY